MKLALAILARAGDAIDALFEASGRVLRVLLRGAFEPDAQSYRGARFAELGASDILVQEIDLNAADAGQARRAVALDPERHLPLSPDAALFDIAGPLPDEGPPRARPERRFLLGVVRKDGLSRLREAMPKARRGGVEAFVYAPPGHAGAALAFTDDAGRRRRRFRRAVTALAFLALGATAWDTSAAWRESLDEATLQAEAERLGAERRVRLAERRLLQSTDAAAASSAQAPPLARASERLAMLAARLPPGAELTELSIDGAALVLRGRAHAPEALELELRRGFEAAAISFSSEPGEAPQPFEARIAWPDAEGAAP